MFTNFIYNGTKAPIEKLPSDLQALANNMDANNDKILTHHEIKAFEDEYKANAPDGQSRDFRKPPEHQKVYNAVQDYAFSQSFFLRAAAWSHNVVAEGILGILGKFHQN